MTDLAELKRFWLTSMASIVMRVKDLDYISQDCYKYLNISVEWKRLKKKEPVEVYIDSPKIFETAYKMYKNELGYTNDDLSKVFALPDDVIDRLFSGAKQRRLRISI